MDQRATHFGDNLSHLPVRQWVLPVSKRLHDPMPRDEAALSSALHLFCWLSRDVVVQKPLPT